MPETGGYGNGIPATAPGALSRKGSMCRKVVISKLQYYIKLGEARSYARASSSIFKRECFIMRVARPWLVLPYTIALSWLWRALAVVMEDVVLSYMSFGIEAAAYFTAWQKLQNT